MAQSIWFYKELQNNVRLVLFIYNSIPKKFAERSKKSLKKRLLKSIFLSIHQPLNSWGMVFHSNYVGIGLSDKFYIKYILIEPWTINYTLRSHLERLKYPTKSEDNFYAVLRGFGPMVQYWFMPSLADSNSTVDVPPKTWFNKFLSKMCCLYQSFINIEFWNHKYNCSWSSTWVVMR